MSHEEDSFKSRIADLAPHAGGRARGHPEEALEEIIAMLDGVIAGTTDNTVRHEPERARKALAGGNDRSVNGALDMVKAGNRQAALAFLRQLIDRPRGPEGVSAVAI